MSEDARAMELLGTDYHVEGGVERLLAFIRNRLHTTDMNLEQRPSISTSTTWRGKKGETLMQYINAEYSAYRKPQRVLNYAMEDCQY